MAPKSEKLKEVEALQARSRVVANDEDASPSSPPPPLSPQLSSCPSYQSSLDEGEIVLAQGLPDTKEVTEYAFYYTKLRRANMIICSGATKERNPLYFVEVSEFTYKKTDVQMYRVPVDFAATVPNGRDLTTKEGIKGPLVGVAKFPTLSRDFAIGFGNPDDAKSECIWERVKNAQAIKHGQYDFFYTNPHEGPNAQPVKYSWHRTHAEEDGVDGSKWARHINKRCWKLIDHRSGEIMALMTANFAKKWSKVGKMLVFGSRTPEFEVMILLSFSAISEKARRRAWKRRSAARGGGGG